MTDPNTAEAERLFSLLTMAAGEDADRDLYYDETAGAWDLEGLRSDLALYSPQAAAAPASQPVASAPPPPVSELFAAPPPPVSELFAAPAATPQAPPQMTAPPPQMQHMSVEVKSVSSYPPHQLGTSLYSAQPSP